MKPNRVATLNAGQLKAVYQALKNSGTLLIMSMLLIFISCDKSDDLETIGNEPPNTDQPPIDNEPPVEEPPVDEEPPTDDESPTDDASVIVYTDIEPDFISGDLSDYYNLDMNNDQIIDFILISEGYENYEWLRINSSPNVENSIISYTPWYSHPISLNSGKEIFNLQGYTNGESYETWAIFADCYSGKEDCYFYWKENIDNYLGLRFFINGNTHYGWARVNVTSVTQWVIKDYAYNATPNKPILAGQKE
mgnify:CR=1 FL=1